MIFYLLLSLLPDVLANPELVFKRTQLTLSVRYENLDKASNALISDMVRKGPFEQTKEPVTLMIYGIQTPEQDHLNNHWIHRKFEAGLVARNEVDLFHDAYQDFLFNELGLRVADKVPSEEMARFAQGMDIPFIVSGSIIPMGGKYRMTLVLTEAESGSAIWTGLADFTPDDALVSW